MSEVLTAEFVYRSNITGHPDRARVTGHVRVTPKCFVTIGDPVLSQDGRFRLPTGYYFSRAHGNPTRSNRNTRWALLLESLPMKYWVGSTPEGETPR